MDVLHLLLLKNHIIIYSYAQQLQLEMKKRTIVHTTIYFIWIHNNFLENMIIQVIYAKLSS